MTDDFAICPFLLYRYEKQVTRDLPAHIDLDPKSMCSSAMVLESVEYLNNAYLRIAGHCQRHQERMYWIADYIHGE